MRSLYEIDASKVTFAMVKRFVTDAETADLLAESMTLELKVKRSGSNIAEAVAGLANADGGIILVGVDGSASPREGRLPGIPRSDLDGVVEHLRGLLEVLPEIIPVAIPDTHRLIVVIRVDSDAFPHPVLISGRVVYRVPGATVPADRRRVVELVDRDRQAPAGSTVAFAPAVHDPQRLPLWGDDDEPLHVAIRVMGGLRLPERVTRRPWLTTPARNALIEALESSQVPRGLWLTERGEAAVASWRVKDRRSNWLTAVSPGDGGRLLTASEIAVSSGAHLALEGRSMSCLLGTRLRSVGGAVVPLGLGDLYYALFVHVIAVRDACVAVADALGAADPATSTPWRGWLQAGDGFAVPHVVNLEPYQRDSSSHNVEAVLPQMSAESSDNDLDEMVRDWLTVFLLDLGVRDFEGEIAGFRRPKGSPPM